MSRSKTVYGPPNGRTFLVRAEAELCGCAAYHRLEQPGICEMKRLFVSERFQGRGIGRELGEAVIRSATDEGFTLMRLDTASLTEAIALYRSLGFRRCAPYKLYPERLMRYLVFMERPLAAGLRTL